MINTKKTNTFYFLQEDAASEVANILNAVFTRTLDMINKDMEAYPEFRTNFFQLLSAINRYCFSVMISLPDDIFNIIVQAIVWAFKHSMRNVAEIGIIQL